MLLHDVIPHHHHGEGTGADCMTHKHHDSPGEKNDDTGNNHKHQFYHSHFGGEYKVRNCIRYNEILNRLAPIACLAIGGLFVINPPPLLEKIKDYSIFHFFSDFFSRAIPLRAPPGL